MNLEPLILASTSRYRRELMERLHLTFQSLAPLADEEALKNQWQNTPSPLTPQQLAEKLALAKAESLCDLHPNQWVIGSDQLIDFKGEILGKQPDFDSAFAQLKKLSNHTHTLITAVALCQKGKAPICFCDRTEITFMPLSDEEIKIYLQIEAPYDCAGSYKMEALGSRLFKELKTTDPSAIIGLPLIRLSQELKALGYGLQASTMA